MDNLTKAQAQGKDEAALQPLAEQLPPIEQPAQPLPKAGSSTEQRSIADSPVNAGRA